MSIDASQVETPINVDISQTEVVASLNRSVHAFNKGSLAFFDEFAAEATIFTADSPEPIKGREAYQKRYETALSSQGREKTILDQKIQIVGNKAVVTQKARITEAGSSAEVFQTLIYGQTTEGVKVVHSQTSLLTQSNDNGNGPQFAVQVVKERIAPSNPIVGVAQ